jgi:hypothetical protein
VAEELDTSWFDLMNYEAFKTMSIEDWQRRLEDRYFYAFYLRNQAQDDDDKKYFLDFLSNAADCLKKGDATIFNDGPPKF